ncbi:hypothetical protein ACFQI7_33325 [Paenibacillus allorhizosphaerae]|uniref:Uncharacterized protein n=1 Tax=Paenibacillus allorhizosphaerae TaxID=2849866 RepID=A0ABN7TSU4_9BACL|nr:hypothetical protein [Paenibacillus allorhizosphaerae]CAG7654354.1 hypothetical protein PAECIP111802_05749 [Paenibacillus allorhizosphaerae]
MDKVYAGKHGNIIGVQLGGYIDNWLYMSNIKRTIGEVTGCFQEYKFPLCLVNAAESG